MVEAGLVAELLESLQAAGERGGALRRLGEEALDLDPEGGDVVLDGGASGIAERRAGLRRGVDGDDVEPGGADGGNGGLEPAERVGVRGGDPVDASIVAERDCGARVERLHQRAADVVARVGGEKSVVRGRDGADEIVAGVIGVEVAGSVAIQADPGFLVGLDVPRVVARLEEDREDDLVVVLLAQAEEVVVLADLGLADGGLERLLRRGRFGEEARRETGGGPQGREGEARDPGVGERPPDDVSDVRPVGLQVLSEGGNGHEMGSPCEL